MSVVIDAGGIADIEAYFDRFPGIAARAASLAINDTARGPAIDLATAEMYREVNFPAGYIEDDRLSVVQFSAPDYLQATIRGRDRPTSLARFQEGATFGGSRNPGPISVTVHPGDPQPFDRGFLVRLKNGNVGFAIRLRPGEPLLGSRAINHARFGRNDDVYLLYGPSVDQVFKGVAADISPQVGEALEVEFKRQLARLVNNDA